MFTQQVVAGAQGIRKSAARFIEGTKALVQFLGSPVCPPAGGGGQAGSELGSRALPWSFALASSCSGARWGDNEDTGLTRVSQVCLSKGQVQKQEGILRQ